MMHSAFIVKVLLLAASAGLIAGHGAIIAATGDAGGQGTALGIDKNTPRDGTGRNPFQQDTTIFSRRSTTGCGRTLGGGPNDVAAGTDKVIAEAGGLPQVTAGGTVTMTLHQINVDGAGPYTCMIDMTGTGTNFQPLTVTTQVPGRFGLSRNGAKTDFPLVASLPADMECAGTAGSMTGICMVKCQNPIGPFGGCVPVQQVNSTPTTPNPPPTAVSPPAESSGAPQQSLVPLTGRRLQARNLWRD